MTMAGDWDDLTAVMTDERSAAQKAAALDTSTAGQMEASLAALLDTRSALTMAASLDVRWAETKAARSVHSRAATSAAS